jgi:hypothetical protein
MKFSKASFMCPLEQNVVSCCFVSEKLSFCKWGLKEIEEKKDFEFSIMAGAETRQKLVRGNLNLAMDEM